MDYVVCGDGTPDPCVDPALLDLLKDRSWEGNGTLAKLPHVYGLGRAKSTIDYRYRYSLCNRLDRECCAICHHRRINLATHLLHSASQIEKNSEIIFIHRICLGVSLSAGGKTRRRSTRRSVEATISIFMPTDSSSTTSPGSGMRPSISLTRPPRVVAS
jgi:hypothetical protein